MESSFEKALPRKTNKVTVKKPNIDCLRIFIQKLTDEQCLDFRMKYGKLLILLKVDVQVDAIYALTQFYDPPLRCYTFQDFQLVPTLEEFAKIMRYPLTKGKPYHYIGSPYSFETIANVLKVKPNDLKGIKENRNTIVGIPIKYFETRMKDLYKNGEWEQCMDVLALIIYGVVLFPSVDDLVSLEAISVFINYKCEGENPVSAVLADVFYTSNICHEKKGKKLLCCLPVLYVWMTGHIFQRGYKSCCPISDSRRLGLKTHNTREWVKILVELKDEKLRWYPKWGGVDKVLYRCGEFTNVPLVGTRGCINYNPALALRQLGYPMIGPPLEESYALLTADLTDIAMLKRICRAWGKVVYKGYEELGPRSSKEENGYKKWVQDRVACIKLPFQMPSNQEETTSSSIPEENLEVKEMKLKLEKVEEEKSALEDELMEMRSYMRRTKLDLTAVKKELGVQNAEKIKVVEENKKLKATQEKMKHHLNTLKTQINDQAAEFEEMKKENEEMRLVIKHSRVE